MEEEEINALQMMNTNKDAVYRRGLPITYIHTPWWFGFLFLSRRDKLNYFENKKTAEDKVRAEIE